MLRIALFTALLIGSCGYALWRGGAPERIVAVALVSAFVATLLSYTALAQRFTDVEYGIFFVDIILMAVLTAVALRADRGWPLVLAGLHLGTLGAHAVKLFEPEIIRVTYAVMIAFWSYPMLIALAIGTRRHRQRIRVNGLDRDWSLPPRRSGRAPIPKGQSAES